MYTLWVSGAYGYDLLGSGGPGWPFSVWESKVVGIGRGLCIDGVGSGMHAVENIGVSHVRLVSRLGLDSSCVRFGFMSSH